MSEPTMPAPTTGADELTDEEMDRFWRHVEKRDDGCWIWTAAKSHKGYGLTSIGGCSRHAHRLAYLILVGEIPEGRQIDHLCRNRACVNPAHLEPVTSRENTLRGMSPTAIAWRTGICKHGHKKTPENTYVRADGERVCKTCRNAGKRRARRIRREQAQGVQP